MNRIFAGAALSILLVAAPAAAQESQENRFLLEPYAGVFTDSYDISPDGENRGMQLGLRLGYEMGGRLRLLANAGYASSAHVGNPNGLPDYFVYDNTWALTTVGTEYDVIGGPTSIALGLQVGAGWRRLDRTGQVGSPEAYTDAYGGHGFSRMDMVVPGLTLRHRVSARTALMLSVQDQMFDVLEGPVNHSPAVSVGLSVR